MPFHIKHYIPVAISFITIIIAGTLQLFGAGDAARAFIFCVAIIVTVKLSFEMIQSLRQGHVGIDILAIIAIISTLAVNEYWASIIIILMLTGGEALEKYAGDRAKTELTALISRTPQEARKIINDTGEVETVPINSIMKSDRLSIRPGEVVPVDSILESKSAVLDESSLTGESLPVTVKKGGELLSGAVNTASTIVVQALKPASESQYQKIVALVKQAATSQAPFVRLADTFAVPFTLISLVIAGAAWVISGDPVRFAEVLVLATPCPLLLATPIALMSGMSLSAKNGIIVKSGAVLEQLAHVKTVAFDKTGTLTYGAPTVTAITAYQGYSDDDVLRCAATAEQSSLHTLAAAIVTKAKQQGLTLSSLDSLDESVGNGVVAKTTGETIIVGKRDYLQQHHIDISKIGETESVTKVFVAVNAVCIGSISFQDEPRKESRKTVQKLRKLGIKTIMMLTGDTATTARRIGQGLHIKEQDIHAELLPEDKVNLVKNAEPKPVMMVGDGVNDAPVLTTADVGVAMGARGSTAATETADVVVLVDDISKSWQAIYIAQKAIRIATQGILIGISVSIGLMLVATTGVIPAILGAVLQEVLDVLIIFNALRVHAISVTDARVASNA